MSSAFACSILDRARQRGAGAAPRSRVQGRRRRLRWNWSRVRRIPCEAARLRCSVGCGTRCEGAAEGVGDVEGSASAWQCGEEWQEWASKGATGSEVGSDAGKER